MNGLQLYCRYVWISFKAQMQYKASFWMFACANAANTSLDFFAIYAFFLRFGGLGEWTIYEVGLFYGMTNTAFAVNEAWMRGFDTFSRMIRNAEFDRVLVRPRSTVLQILGSEFQLLRVGRLSVGLAVLIWAIRGLGLPWNAGQWALLVFSILGGAVLYGGIILIQATSCFWTVESLEIFNTVTYGGVETSQYPLSIYDGWLRRFFTYIVPLAAINYWPCSALLGRGYVPGFVAYGAPLAGILFYGVGLMFWRFGVKHYRSTGS